FVAMLPAIGAAVVAMAPFLLIGAAVGLLAKVIMDNWEPISGFFSNLWGAITGGIDAAMVFIGEKIEWFKNNWAFAIGYAITFVATLPIRLPALIAQAASAMINVLRNVNWGEAFNRIITALNNAISWLWNSWTSIW